jgi:predicted acetyltransferase
MLLLDRPNFRQAREDDRERLVELEGIGYPSEASYIERERAIFHNPYGELRDLVVGEVDGDIVCQAFLFRLVTHYGGRPVKTGGVACVAVAPEARGRGVATALMEHLHSIAAKRGAPLTMLCAFRQGFYTRLGYAAATSRKRLSIDPRSIPRTWNAPVRRARGAERSAIEKLYASVARTMSGVHDRPKALWDLRFAKSSRIILTCDDGYVMFELRQDVLHAETTLVVQELVAKTPAARRALLGALGRMRDQVTTIELEVAEDDPLELALVDPDGRRFGDDDVEHELGRIVGGPLVRITDVEKAFEARGYLVDGVFAINVDDRRLGVAVKGGRATVGKPRGPVVTTTRRALAALLFGGLGLRQAVTFGLAEVESKALSRIDSVLRLPPVVPFDPF